MPTRNKAAVILILLCLLTWRWLDSLNARPTGLRNESRTIPAGAPAPVFGFYSDQPTLVTVDGQGCSTQLENDCWGPDGKNDIPRELQQSLTLMQERPGRVPDTKRGP